jgi:PAS domain S-box-containing protein
MDTARATPPAERRRTESLWATALDVAGVGIGFVDPHGRLIDANPALARMLGCPRDALVGQPWTVAARADVVERAEAYLAALQADPPRDAQEWPVRRRDGRTLHALASLRAVDDARHGRVVVIALTDVGGRRQAEDELRASEQRLREISQTIDEVFWIADPVRRELLYVSAGYEKIWGRAVASVMASRDAWLQGIHPDDRDRVQAAIARRTTGEQEVSFRVVRPDGTLRWVRDRAFPVRDLDGRVVRVTGITADISAEVAALDQARRLARSLEQRVAERTAELAEQVGALQVARAALAASEERYRYLVDHVGESIVVLQDERVAFCNPRLGELLALPLERIVGHPLHEFVHPDDAPTMLDRHRRRLAGDEAPAAYPLRVVRSDGRVLWIDLRVTLVQWQGRPAALGLASDVSERRALEARLRDTLAERETILDNSIVGIFFLDAEARIQWANRSAQQMLGIDPGALPGLGAEALFADADTHTAFVQRAGAAMRRQRALREEIELVRGDGARFWALVSGQAVGDWGAGEGSVWSVLDIGERKALEAELRRTSAELEVILHSALVGVAYTAERAFQWVNRTLTEMLGHRPHEMLGHSTRMLHVDEASWHALGEACEPVLRRGEAFEAEWPLRHRDGRTVWALLHGRAIDAAEPSLRIIWTLLDITERRRAVEDMQRALAQQRELGELKSRFVAMTSHEFRTPLAAILSSAELLRDYRDRLPAAERDELLGIVQSSVRRMGRMLDDVLALGRADAQALAFAPAPLALRPLVESVLADARRAAADAGHGQAPVRLRLRGSAAPRALDERLLRHMLANLVGNAIKYSPDGTVVEVEVDARDDATVFSVTDRGIGIPDEHLPVLFEPFYRARNVGTIGGTGLGMAVVKRAVDRHGGRIEVASRVGEGTRVVVTLPRGD